MKTLMVEKECTCVDCIWFGAPPNCYQSSAPCRIVWKEVKADWRACGDFKKNKNHGPL